jgi:hypothetical protein
MGIFKARTLEGDRIVSSSLSSFLPSLNLGLATPRPKREKIKTHPPAHKLNPQEARGSNLLILSIAKVLMIEAKRSRETIGP